eukprot:1951429-Pleurochrysis_carterae.AAC.1
MLSAGGLRQQFSLAANIDLSLYGIDFLRRVPTDLRLPGEDAPDIQFREQGYLFLASDKGEKVLRENHETQRSRGVDWMSLLTQDELARQFPWLNVDGISLGSLGEANEGWFDPWALLTAMRAKSAAMGVAYIKGAVEAMTVCDEGTRSDRESLTSGREGVGHGLAGEAGAAGCGDEGRAEGGSVGGSDGSGGISGSSEACGAHIKSIECVHIRGKDGLHAIRAGTVVNAAGAFAARVVGMCGDVAPLPVAARKRCIFSVHCAQAQSNRKGEACDVPRLPPETTTPLVVDPSGVYMRPEGPPARYLCGVSPPSGWGDPDSASTDDLDLVDHALFDEVIWPALYHRCEAFGSLKVQSSWAGFYEYNTFDQNAIIGPHPHVSNLILCNGFSGHGLQHAPGAGLAVAELLSEGRFRTINVACFGFERVMRGERVLEHGIV